MQFHQAHLSPVPPDRMVVMLQGHPSHLTSPPHQMYSPSSLKPLTSLPSHLVYLVPCGQMPRLPPCPKLPCQDQVHSRCSVQVQGCREGSLTLLHKDAPLGEVNSSSSARRASLVWWVEGWISVCARACACVCTRVCAREREWSQSSSCRRSAEGKGNPRRALFPPYPDLGAASWG